MPCWTRDWCNTSVESWYDAGWSDPPRFCVHLLDSRSVRVGLAYIEGVLTGPTGKQATVKFLVGSGATYTLVPAEQARLLELQPKRTVAFSLADGTTIE